MPGLLQKLQKSRVRTDESVSVVLLSSSDGDGISPGISSETQSGQSDGNKLIRRHSGLTQSIQRTALSGDDAKVDWNIAPRKLPPRVERVFATICSVFEAKIRTLGDFDTEGEAAINEAAAKIPLPVPLSRKERELALRELHWLLGGAGPLAPLFEDSAVSQIYVDDYRTVKVIRRGQTLTTPITFRSPEEYQLYARWLFASRGFAFGENAPIADIVLNDKWRSRVNAIDPSVANGSAPRLAIRIPREQRLSFYDILQAKMLPATLAAWLSEVVQMREANILVSGPFGSGKTLMTTALLSGISSEERVITIEEIPEIFVPGPHVEKLVARPASAEGHGAVGLCDLFRAAIRRTPHRIAVGELREEAGAQFVRTLEAGFSGSIASIHGNSSEEGLWRLLDLLAAHESGTEGSYTRRISRVVHLVITMGRDEGRPVLQEVVEVAREENGHFQLIPLVVFDGVKEGKRRWRLLRESSVLIDKLAKKGKKLRPGVGLYSESYEDASKQ